MDHELTQPERIELLNIIYVSQGSCSPEDIKKHFNCAYQLITQKTETGSEKKASMTS